MPRLAYLASARRDLAGILEYITKQIGSLATGRRFVDLLHMQCQKLASLPVALGRPRPELRSDMRSFTFRAYVIFFRYEADTLEVVDVLERLRDVEAWFRDDTA